MEGVEFLSLVAVVNEAHSILHSSTKIKLKRTYRLS